MLRRSVAALLVLAAGALAQWENPREDEYFAARMHDRNDYQQPQGGVAR
jgi:nitrous oxide reductase accessory protein NosL